jgi:hypothetical protein
MGDGGHRSCAYGVIALLRQSDRRSVERFHRLSEAGLVEQALQPPRPQCVVSGVGQRLEVTEGPDEPFEGDRVNLTI